VLAVMPFAGQPLEPVCEAQLKGKPVAEQQIEPAPHRELRYRSIFTGQAREPLRQFQRTALEFSRGYDFGN
jgi:hypothetical protein